MDAPFFAEKTPLGAPRLTHRPQSPTSVSSMAIWSTWALDPGQGFMTKDNSCRKVCQAEDKAQEIESSPRWSLHQFFPSPAMTMPPSWLWLFVNLLPA